MKHILSQLHEKNEPFHLLPFSSHHASEVCASMHPWEIYSVTFLLVPA